MELLPKGISIREGDGGERRAVGRCPRHGRLSRAGEFELTAEQHWVCPECAAVIRFDGERVQLTDAQGDGGGA